MSNRKHFFFKQGRGNCGFLELKKSKNHGAVMAVGDEVELGIFFSNDLDDNTSKSDVEKNPKLSKNRKQICSFIYLKQGDCLWVFDREIYCFECLDQKMTKYDANDPNTPPYLDEGKGGTSAKVKKFKCLKCIKLEDVPEMFSTTSSNLSYNQRTIVEFEDTTSQYEVCKSIVSRSKIDIDNSNFIDYMSPSQFETLNFLIFYFSGKIPKSHIGLSRKYVDLEVFDPKNQKTEFYQVKKKDYDLPCHKDPRDEIINDHDVCLIHTGKTDSTNKNMILGKDWILQQICHQKTKNCTLYSVKDWVRYLFPENLFDVKDLCKNSAVTLNRCE